MLEIRNLSAGYGDKTVLNSIHLTAPTGKITAILGPNGCGKTTLLKTLCGILPAQAGQVLLDGEDLLSLPPRFLARKVAYLAQSHRIPNITVGRLVLHGRFPYLSYPRRYRQEDYEAANAAMARMGLEDLAEAPLNQLSGGQLQKVYIAMALAQNTPVILLDEPTTYLDIRHQLHLMRQAKELAVQGKTVLMVIHDLAHGLQTADHVILMEEGRVAAAGTPEELFAAGCIDQVFGIRLGRARTDTGWHYYCQESAR